MKTRSNISIDSELKQKAQDRGLEISGLTEWAIRQKLGQIEVEANETLRCEFCNKEGYKETAENVPLNEPSALTWLYPDERWICNKCLKIKSRHVAVAHR